jgi:hypothetical protein
MIDRLSGSQASAPLRPLGVVPDANVFTRQVWVDRLVAEANEGRIRLYWSPKTVEEVGRVRLWIWVKRELRVNPPPAGSRAWKLWWRRYSAEAHAWFARVSPLASVVEDRPPHEPAWIEPHPDPNDAWLWNAARRVGADFVVTENLRDAPSATADALRSHERVIYIHPDAFALVLDMFGGILDSGELPDNLVDQLRRTAAPYQIAHVPAAASALRMVLAQMADEAEAATVENGPGA